MANTSTSNFANFLVRNYSREKAFAPFERQKTRWLDSIEDAPNRDAFGAGNFFWIGTADAHSTGAAAEGSVFPDTYPQQGLQGQVNPVSILGSMGITDQMLIRGVAKGTFGPNTLNKMVTGTIKNTLMTINRLTLCGHGTGRLAVVQDATSSLTTFVVRNPEHLLQLRKGMHIDFYDTDTGGTKQGATEEIVALNRLTRTVTIGNARSLTAGWGLYQALTSSVSTYGIAPNGLRGIADDGTLQGTIYGLSRSTNPTLNATVRTVSSGTQSYSETLVRSSVDDISMNGDIEPDEIWMNVGVRSEHLKHTIPDRRYNVMAGGALPDYKIGFNSAKLGFQLDGKFLPFEIDRDYPDRELVVVTKKMARKTITRRLNWLADDSDESGASSPYLFQAPSSSTYSLNKLACILWDGNWYHEQPMFLTRTTQISDVYLAGDPA